MESIEARKLNSVATGPREAFPINKQEPFAERGSLWTPPAAVLDPLPGYTVFSLSENGSIRTWSSEAERLYGYSAPEILNRSFEVLLSGESLAQLSPKQELELARDTGVYHCQRWGLRKDKTRFWAEEVVAAVPGHSSELIGFTKMVRTRSPSWAPNPDWTWNALEHIPGHAIFAVDREGRLQSWNQGVFTLFGFSEEEFVGQPSTRLFSGEDLSFLQLAPAQVHTLGERFFTRKDGSQFWGATSLHHLHAPSNLELAMAVIVRDQSAQRLADQALSKARAGLEQRVVERTVELSQAIDLLEQQLIERERLESALLGAAETERERLGQDLHDGVCQQLTGTALLAQVLATGLQRRNAPESTQAQKIVELLQSATNEARDLAKGLHPVSLTTTEGLVAALHELKAMAETSVPCLLECPDQLELPSACSLHLYRIAQESVRNALKHAQADEIAIQVRIEKNDLILTVHDNGRGLQTQADHRGGMGLLNLQYRARAIGASLKLESHPGQGTTVKCVLPLKGKSDASPASSPASNLF